MPLGMAMLTAFLVTAAGNMVNDFFDFDIDRKLGKAKVSTREKSILLFISGALFAAGLGIAGNLPEGAFGIAAVVSLMLILYSALLYRMKYIGNLVVALGTALTLVFGAALTGSVNAVALPALAAFFANIGREIIKDNEDMKGDEGAKKTLPMVMKPREVKKAVFAMYMAAIASGIIAFMLGIFSGLAFIALFAASAAALISSFRLFSERKFGEAQKHSKYGMVAALAAFIAGTL